MNEFDIDVPVERAWPLLLDVAGIVHCVPGAELLEQLDEHTFKGRVSVKLGPVLLAFEGTAKFEEVDAAAHRALVSARGMDKKGRGSASAIVTMAVAPKGSSSRVSASTDLQLSGSVAQYGRASGLIAEVSQQLVDEFAANLNRRILETASTKIADVGQSPVVPKSAMPISGFRLGLRLMLKSLARLLGLGARRQ